MKFAQKKLIETTETITDIAYSLGFESLSAFYTSFGKTYGMTPKEFRTQLAKSLTPEGSTTQVVETVLGPVTIVSNGEAVVSLQFGRQVLGKQEIKDSCLAARAAGELLEYFSGRSSRFTIPLAPEGTAFQKEVWAALCQIPFGETRTYKDIALDIGKSGASRAVGMANNKNPILIMIPCHRVTYANGALGGYAGGVDLKERLLIHESECKVWRS
jgi:O-6-methylguanine DNA methyltransferase